MLVNFTKPVYLLLTIINLIFLIILIRMLTLNRSFTTFSPHNLTTSIPFNLALNTTANSTLPILCIFVRIYWVQLSYFPILALALYHNGLHNIRIYVTNTDNRTDIDQLKQTIDFINHLVLRDDFVRFLDLGDPPSSKDFGYTMTDRALSYFYKQNLSSSSTTCRYITFTNGDNFYSRNLAKILLSYMQDEEDIIAWDFISHHYWPRYYKPMHKQNRTGPQIVDHGTEKCISTEIRVTAVDLGAVAYRLAFLQKHNLYFRSGDGSYSSTSDGHFAVQAVTRAKTSVILRQTLLLHQ